MARQYTALALIGSSLVALGLGLTLAACDGDDTNPALPDSGTDATTALQDSGKGDATGAVDAGEDGGACEAYDAAGLNDAAVKLGLSIVVAEHCQTCHGESFSGNSDGVDSPGYGTAFPPNLTPDAVTGLGCWTDSQIEEAFLHGVDNEGAVLCPPMPRFGEEDGGIDSTGAAGVVAFLRSLPAITNQVPDSPNCSLPPDAGEDGGTVENLDGGHHHDGGGFGHDAGQDASDEDGGAVDGGTDATVVDAGNEDAGD